MTVKGSDWRSVKDEEVGGNDLTFLCVLSVIFFFMYRYNFSFISFIAMVGILYVSLLYEMKVTTIHLSSLKSTVINATGIWS